MNKKVILRYIILSISIILMACAFPQRVMAAHAPGKVDVDILEQGSKVKLKHSRDYTRDNDNNIFCMNVNRDWASESKEITFTVKYKLKINGKKATVIGGSENGKSWNSVYNAQLAYILNSNGTMGGTHARSN